MAKQQHVQPQSIEAEKAVLGSILKDGKAIDQVAEQLKPEHFYKEAHSKIYQRMLELYHRGVTIDMVSLMNELKANKELENVGGMYTLTGYEQDVPTVANVMNYVAIVIEKSIKRVMIETGNDLVKEGYEDHLPANQILESAERKIFQLSQTTRASKFEKLEDLLPESIEQIDIVHSNRDSAIGLPSGYSAMDRMLLGFHKSDLTYIAGRPSMGKTALAVCIANNAAKAGHGVGIFSLEMSKKLLTDRILFSEARIDSHKARGGFLTEEMHKKIMKKAEELAELPIFINETIENTISPLRSQARKLKAKEDISLLVVDYLQLLYMDGRFDSRQQEITKISGILKNLAKELDIPIIAVSQLSRALESRQGDAKRPRLSDLRESGSIEQDGDVILGLYRPYAYIEHEKSENKRKELEKRKAEAEVIILKHRNGPTGTIMLSWLAQFTRFEAFDPQHEELFE